MRPAPFLAWWTTTTAMPWRRCSSRRKASNGATSPLAFSSMRCRRTKGSRMSRRGCNRATVSARLFAIGIEIEAEGGSGDDLDVEIGERDAGGLADAVEAASHDV